MKAVIVNKTEKHIASKEIENNISTICNYFAESKIRNSKWLKEKSEITVVFLRPIEIKKINNEFRNKNKATDILSFSSDDPLCLGELLLCPDVLKKQAKTQKHSFQHEMIYMLIHGILHLLGYDHERSAAEEKLMFKLQNKCFKTLGQKKARAL